MAIVKSVKGMGRLAGRVLDAEDRRVLGQGVVLVTGAGFVIVSGAGILGLAWRLFWLAAG